MAQLARFRREVIAYGGDHGRAFPWRDTNDPYRVLVAELLLQRTRGEHVVPVYREMLRRWPTVERLARARVSTIERVIAPLGLIKRASMIKQVAQEIASRGGVPLDPNTLAALPGIGPYGAHAIPVFADGQDLPLVDWVIARVLRRYFGLPGERRPNADPDLWDVAADLASRGNARSLWLGVLDLGAAVCAKRPRCSVCPLEESCASVKPLAI